MIKKSFFYLTVFLVLVIHSILSAQDQNITITSNINADKSIDLYYEKKQPGSYYLSLEFSNITNCNTSNYKTIVSNYSGRLVKLTPIDKNQGIGYSLQYYYITGKPNPKIDTEFQYILPFKSGKKIKIYEASYVGEKYFGSEKPKNWTHYIVNSESPDTLYCMRKGIVVKLVDEYAPSTSEMHYTSNRNSVIIEHADGTFAKYEGFKKNSIPVKLGQTVYPKTLLGIMEVFNKNNYRASFSIYFLADENFRFKQSQTLKNYKSEYEYVIPNFVTEEGVLKVESGKEYTSLFNEKIMFQELTNSEKKKYLKNTLFLN